MEESYELAEQSQQIQSQQIQFQQYSNTNIWNQLIECTETNVLETRENIIRFFASSVITVEAIHKIYDLTQIYMWSWCYNELYEHVVNSKQINLSELISKIKKNFGDIHKLENEFPQNIYKWKDIGKFTEKIDPNAQLLLTPKVIKGIKRLDLVYERFVLQINAVLDKYQTHSTINFNQLIDIKNQFINAQNLLPSKLSIYCSLH
jgi:hypothetical protein